MAYIQPPTRSSADQVLSADWNTYVRDNFIEVESRKEISSDEYTSGDVTISATTAATANTIVTATAFTPNGTDSYRVTFECPAVSLDANAGGNSCIFHLYDGSTNLGRIATVSQGANATMESNVFASRKVTPTNASHTYSVRAHRTNANCTIQIGSGTADAYFGATIRITRLP